jgi:hypothetical protein
MADKRSPAEILAFRDEASPTPELCEKLRRDAKQLLALVDARLLALALALPDKLDPGAVWSLPDDGELVSYLLSTIRGERQRDLERRLRGNPRVFKRLLELRAALISSDSRMLRPPPAGLPIPTSRESLGTIRFRRFIAHLEFEYEGRTPAGVAEAEDLVLTEARRPPELRGELRKFAFESLSRIPLGLPTLASELKASTCSSTCTATRGSAGFDRNR